MSGPGVAAVGAPVSLWRMTWRRFRRHRLAMAGLVVLLVLYVVAIFAPFLAPSHYNVIDTKNRFRAPDSEFPLGADRLGRCILSRIIWGSRVSLSIGLVAAGVAVILGTAIGAIAGYFGGVVDDILMRLTEVIMALPGFFLLLAIRAMFGGSIFMVMAIIGLTTWPGLARIVRGQILSLKETEFTEAARAVGALDGRIILRHIIPNTMAPVIVSATLRVGGAILTESGLSFLGLGVPEPFPSWGSILNAGRDYIRYYPWITFYPGMFIFMTVLAFNFVGDGLRDALDPKLKI